MNIMRLVILASLLSLAAIACGGDKPADPNVPAAPGSGDVTPPAVPDGGK